MVQKKMDILELSVCRKALTARPKTAHKGMFGHVLVVGGDYGMAGAVLLAGTAALRVGAGLVTVATRPEHAINMFTTVPELMTLRLNEPKDLEPLLQRATVILLGPGLGQKEWGRNLFEYLMRPECSEYPMVIDADALNLLSSASKEGRPHWVLTPHPGEAARLLGSTIEAIQHDRLQSVQELQKKYQCTVVLKGAGTLVMGEKDSVKLCNQGNPGMASPGMGDVLGGLIAGLLAQGLSSMDAAALAVVIHATAGDEVKAHQGERGILASDLIGYIPKCLNP